MNKPITSADLVTPKVTTGPLPASRKVYSTPESAPDLRVNIDRALADQRRYVERVSAARERIVARMHHCVATLEKFRMACTQLDATAAAREAADARNAMSILGELGDGLALPPVT